MVQALLAGLKTQTRRLVKAPKWSTGLIDMELGDDGIYAIASDTSCLAKVKSRISVGDRLYVREQWRTFASFDPLDEDHKPKNLLVGGRGAGIAYEAGGGLSIGREPDRAYTYQEGREDLNAFGKLRQAIHLPRWGTRITLIVQDIKFERLQDISEEDAVAEGIERSGPYWRDYQDASRTMMHPQGSYMTLWESINDAGSWDANPWIVAYAFSVIKENIDRIAA